jgi:hypothetical protein
LDGVKVNNLYYLVIFRHKRTQWLKISWILQIDEWYLYFTVAEGE